MTASEGIHIRQARPVDADAIVTLIRKGFALERMPFLVYGCDGVTAFVRGQIEMMGSGGDSIHVVACRGDRVIGCTESGWTPIAQFWNWLSIEPDLREGGIARRLLKAVTERALVATQTDMIIDVFTDNLVAHRWYQRLGFSHHYRSQWWSLPIERPPQGQPTGCLRGFVHAKHAFDHFGFAHFTVVTRSGQYVVGMLGRELFRITSGDALRDAELTATLLSLDASRRIFAIVKEGEYWAQSADATLVATTAHMTISLRDLLSRLKDVQV